MLKNIFTPFGAQVRAKLAQMGQTQEWLCSECRARTGMYVDSGVMNRLLTGHRHSPRLEVAIRDVLGLEEGREAS